MAAPTVTRRRPRRPRRLSLCLILAPCLCLLLAAPAVHAARTPARRAYGTHDYYVLEMQPGADPRELAHALDAELVEQVGELADHWLLRTPKLDIPPRDGVDPILTRYDRLKRAATTTLWATRQTHVGAAALALEHQPLRKRAKRVMSHLQTRQDAPPSDGNVTFSAEVARRFSIMDPLWPKQWHLANDEIHENSINVTGVWAQGVTGKGINVAIVDDGLDMHSDDLAPNFFPAGSWDYNDHTALPEPRLSDDQHGTRCAGEIAAVKNDVCGVGIAYESKIAGIRILSASISDADEASALNFGFHDNDIYSCSWGPPDDGQQMEAPSRLITKAFLNGVQNGRQGRGSLYVFASGNGGGVDDQCNFDGYTNSIFSVTVGAIDRKGLHPYYSEACSAIMVVTYSSGSGDNIHTTDVGKNVCTDRHGGTSAAAPIAAGILALVLQVRPELTWRDVQHLCVNHAIQVNPSDPDWQTTHAGRLFNHKYGYGKLDAWRLVEAARTWSLVKPQAWWESSSVASGAPITAAGAISTIDVARQALGAANFEKLEHVTVTVDIVHGRRGNVEIELESPNGVRSVLARVRRFDEAATGFPGWTFMSVKHWDEDPVGPWKLRVLDRQQQPANGTVNAWRISLWGSAIDASLAQPYKLANDDQIHLPTPPNATPEPSSSRSAFASRPASASAIKSYARPTEHLPDNHGEAEGEAHETFDDLRPTSATSEADVLNPGRLSGLLQHQGWLIAIAVAAIGVPLCLGVVLIIRRRRRSAARSGYSFEAVPGEEDGQPLNMTTMERGRLTGSALYDAFAIDDSDDEEAVDSQRDFSRARRVIFPLSNMTKYAQTGTHDNGDDEGTLYDGSRASIDRQ